MDGSSPALSDLTCPFHHCGVSVASVAAASRRRPWWPDAIDQGILHQQHPDADWGHYRALVIRMAWHSTDTDRMADGRGGAAHGNQRYVSRNSWPDNTNLDKTRRLWPIKQRYGNRISWADLIIHTGNVAPEQGVLGFRDHLVGRWAPRAGWGAGAAPGGGGDGADLGGPQAPQGNPDPVASGKDLRDTFARMGMTVEETVALVAGGPPCVAAHEESGRGWQ